MVSVVVGAPANIWDSRRIPHLHSDRKQTDTKDLDLVNKCQSGKLDDRFWTCVTLIQSARNVHVLIHVSGV